MYNDDYENDLKMIMNNARRRSFFLGKLHPQIETSIDITAYQYGGYSST